MSGAEQHIIRIGVLFHGYTGAKLCFALLGLDWTTYLLALALYHYTQLLAFSWLDEFSGLDSCGSHAGTGFLGITFARKIRGYEAGRDFALDRLGIGSHD